MAVKKMASWPRTRAETPSPQGAGRESLSHHPYCPLLIMNENLLSDSLGGSVCLALEETVSPGTAYCCPMSHSLARATMNAQEPIKPTSTQQPDFE